MSERSSVVSCTIYSKECNRGMWDHPGKAHHSGREYKKAGMSHGRLTRVLETQLITGDPGASSAINKRETTMQFTKYILATAMALSTGGFAVDVDVSAQHAIPTNNIFLPNRTCILTCSDCLYIQRCWARPSDTVRWICYPWLPVSLQHV